MENKLIEPWLGLYLPDDIYFAPQRACRYVQSLGKRIQILSFYVAWGSGRKKPDIPGIERVLRNKFIPMITWEPWRWPHELPEGVRPEEQPEFSLSMILNGKYDDYIWNWALDLEQISGPIFFRPMHEMNGNWYPWCGGVNGNRPEEYIEAWAYIRSIFCETGNDQLMWVWSPYAHSVPDESGNEIWRYYPGSEEVDWLALDGYNWGKTQKWSTWQSFNEVFEKGYKNLIQLAPDKPFMLAEIGCAEEGGDKGNWIEEAFRNLGVMFPKIKGLIWFNIKKECDWRLESSLQSFQAFRKGLTDWVYYNEWPKKVVIARSEALHRMVFRAKRRACTPKCVSARRRGNLLRLLHGVYPERKREILRSLRMTPKRRVRNDTSGMSTLLLH